MPIHNLMEDAATAEISRSQVWQWIRTPKGKLDDGRKVTAAMVRGMIPEVLAGIRKEHGDEVFNKIPYAQAAEIFQEMSTSENFSEFLTLPLYEKLG